MGMARNGLNDCAIARATGIPRRTIRDWRAGKSRRIKRDTACQGHDFGALNTSAYGYLLGLYLGDGCLSEHRRSVFHLRITLDSAYPGIIDECAAAIAAVAPGKVRIGAHSTGRATVVSNYWKHWPCLFPQHGPGRKHLRPIFLASWQRVIREERTESLLRGLIHSDGTRIVATEKKGSYVRRAPRYVFTNHSEDILQIFRSACDMLGIHTTRPSWKRVAVYSKAAVARLDEFIGPKS